MAETLQYLNSLGLSPQFIAVVAFMWKMDKRVSYLEYRERSA